MKNQALNRRQFLRIAGLAALGTASACAARGTNLDNSRTAPLSSSLASDRATAESETASQGTQRSLRIAHMTDFHIQANNYAEGELVKALRHAQAQVDPPDMVLNTGDAIFDSLESDKAVAEAQWQVFNAILEAECKLPVYHAIGNHDIWGWGRADEQIKNDPLYGKNMAIEQLGLKDRFYSFEKGGWHFIVLDSNHLPNEVSKYPYIGKLDDEQYEWLVGDIQSTMQGMPICIVSHIPIIAACEVFDGPNEESGNWVVPASWVHIDARRFRQLFLEHPNVKLCLSGHTHQYESLDYLGVRYLTNGAVCGAWWNGAYMDFPPAYVLVDLYDDGYAESTFVPYQEV